MCFRLRDSVSEAGLTTCSAVKAPVWSPGGDGVIVITAEEDEERL